MSGKQHTLPSVTRWRSLQALLLYGVIAAALTWPLVCNLDRVVVGDPQSDVWKHVWGMWWIRRCLFDEHVLPLYTWLLNYPYGGSLFFIDPLGGLMSLPLQAFMSAATAYNVLVLFNIVLACQGAFLLARDCTRSTPAAFVAGVIYGCSPYLLSNITSGISESFNIGWIPLFIRAYTRALREPGYSQAVCAGGFLAVATIGCWYYGAFCVVYAFFFFFYELARRSREGAQDRASSPVAGARFARVKPWLAVALAWVALELLHDASVEALEGVSFWPRAVISVSMFVLLLALLIRSRRAEPDPPTTRRLALRFFAQGGIVACLWALGQVSRATPLGAQLGSLRRGVFEVLLLAALWGAITLWARVADPLLQPRLLRVRRGYVRLLWVLGAGSLIVATWSVIARPPLTTTERVAWEAWLGIGWLVALGVLHRCRGVVEQALQGWMRARRTRSWRAWLGVAAIGVVAGAAGDYLFLPPSPWGVVVSVWIAGMLAVVLARYGADLAHAAVTATARWFEERGALGERTVARHLYETVFKHAVVVALVSAALVLPVAYVFKHTLNGEVSLVYRVRNVDNIDLHLSDKFHNVSRLIDYVTPGKAAVVRTFTVDRLTRASYVGWIALTLAVLAAVGVRRRDVGWWSGVAVTSTLFSLGPFLYVTSEVRLPWKFPPYMWMYDWFPFFSQVSIPFRFNVVALLALATLTAYGLAHWLRARPLIDRGLIAATLSLAILIEVMYVSPAPFPVPLASRAVPVALQRLAADPVPGGLLDIPVQRFEGELLPGEYFYYQTVHGKSIPNRVEGEIPIYVFKNRFMLQLFHLEHDWPGYPNDTETALKKSLEELRDFRFRYIVLHENLLRAGASARLHGLLDHFLGAPRLVDGAITVYDVGGKS